MKIFYIDINEFKNKNGLEILKPYADIELKSEKRFIEYTLGRYLVKNVAKSIFNLNNVNITLNDNKKPVFEEGNLFFNISHSKNIVIACFNRNPCGIDIEFIKKRDLDKFSKYYKQKFNSLEEFYKFWTLKEADYKLGCPLKSIYSAKFLNNYYLTAVSSNMEKIDTIPTLFE